MIYLGKEKFHRSRSTYAGRVAVLRSPGGQLYTGCLECGEAIEVGGVDGCAWIDEDAVCQECANADMESDTRELDIPRHGAGYGG